MFHSMRGDSFPDTFIDKNRRFKSTDQVFHDYPAAYAHAERLVHAKRGRADAIIFERRVGGKTTDKSRYIVYLGRKHYNTVSIEEAVKIGYDIHPRDRRVHIHSMYNAGQRGIRDMAAFSRNFVESPIGVVSPGARLSSADISPDHDIIGFDHPRTDILVEKTASGKAIRTGGDTFSDRATLANVVRGVLDTNFTREEVRKMNLYFESNPLDMRGAAGTCSTYKGSGKKPVHTISVCQDKISEGVLTHEIVHALRAADGRRAVDDRDDEEIETEYETTLRMQKPEDHQVGYYQFLPGFFFECEAQTAVMADRTLATGRTDKPLKGRRLTHDIVPNTVKRSQIATARPNIHEFLGKHYGSYQMVAEDVDTYFRIKLPDKTITEYHISFTEARPTLAKIKKHLKERFGKDIDAWEWKDGKKVRIITRPKKTGSRKRTTKAKTPAKRRTSVKAKTPAKRRTPARKPVAAKRFGLDAILGVPEGFL